MVKRSEAGRSSEEPLANTHEEETAEKKSGYIPFSEMYLFPFLQQAPPTTVLIGCPCCPSNSKDLLQNSQISENGKVSEIIPAKDSLR